MTAGGDQPGLPPFQLEVARMFCWLPRSAACGKRFDGFAEF